MQCGLAISHIRKLFRRLKIAWDKFTVIKSFDDNNKVPQIIIWSAYICAGVRFTVKTPYYQHGRHLFKWG
jgi:hypothetical protein